VNYKRMDPSPFVMSSQESYHGAEDGFGFQPKERHLSLLGKTQRGLAVDAAPGRERRR
jgi:hypothetical protein